MERTINDKLMEAAQVLIENGMSAMMRMLLYRRSAISFWI